MLLTLLVWTISFIEELYQLFNKFLRPVIKISARMCSTSSALRYLNNSAWHLVGYMGGLALDSWKGAFSDETHIVLTR